MDGARALIIIIRRESEAAYHALLEKNEASTVFSMPCEGTAGKNLLSLLGLEDTEKTLLLSFMPRVRAARLMAQMVVDMGINLPGYGISLSVPVDSIGGLRSMKYLMGDKNDKLDEVNAMEDKHAYPYDLIIAIARKGFSEMVMDAARTAGAGGGTVLHAKGMASHAAATFFGISIAEEKELVLIAARREHKADIMHAIMDKAGSATEARAVVLSLPVDSVAGLRSVMTEEAPKA